MTDALVIIDVQRGMFAFPETQPFDGAETVQRIHDLLVKARAEGVPVFFVQHDGGTGDILDKHGPGFPFHEALTPMPDEAVIVKTRCNAFHGTDLERRLRDAGVERLTVTGMQSDYCVDTFVRAASERDFALRLVADGHTTFDTESLSAAQVIAHENETLNGSFAQVLPAAAVTFGAH